MAKASKKRAAAAPQRPMISVSAHPRATASIRRTKAWAGLIGFAVVGLLSYQAGVAPFEIGVRALLAGIVLYLAAWAAGVALWRQLVIAEAQAQADRIQAERAEAAEALREQQREREASTGGSAA